MLDGNRTYRARVEEVKSADDMVVLVDLGVDGLFKRTRVRLRGVDAPNAYGADKGTEALALRDELRTMTQGHEVDIHVHSVGRGGWVVDMYLHSSAEQININRTLQDRGYIYTKARGD